MEQGLDPTVTTKHYTWYIKQGKMSQVGAFMAVLTGALWPAARLQEEDPIHKCPHCQRAGYDDVADVLHLPIFGFKQTPHDPKNTTLRRGSKTGQLQPT
eukprot:42039-Karenia_brevis.AAC.1